MIGKAAIAMAIGTLAAMAPTSTFAQESGHRVAVVDVAFIFKNLPSIQKQVAAVENELKTYGGTIGEKQEALKATAEQLKSFKPGTPEYAAQEERLASMESKLRLEMARKKKELADAEARIYYENYQRIADGVKRIAQHNSINLVLRYNSEDMDLAEGQSVIRGVMKNVVYHDDALNLTPMVMTYLDKTYVAGAAGNTNR